jgi:hypothetical protein
MAELLQNPSSMAKARKKLTELIGSKQETEESDIWQLKYLQAVVKETFPEPCGATPAASPGRDGDRDKRLQGAQGCARLGERVGDRA